MTFGRFDLDSLPPPVLIIGSHRSGTSMVARQLSAAGLFIGTDLDTNLEPEGFIELNAFLLRSAGGSWDHPAAIRDLLSNAELRTAMGELLRRHLERAGCAALTGSPSAGRPWGWKDPRTTITLPLWLELFPAARVVLVSRHGVDVAASLQAREAHNAQDIRSRLAARRTRRQDARLKERMVSGMQYSFRALTLAGAFDVWQEYEQMALEHTRTLGDQLLHIRFETAADSLEELIRFCGLEAGTDTIEEMRNGFDAMRAFAYRAQPTLTDFADGHADALARFGY